MQSAADFSSPSIELDETLSFARDKVFAVVHVLAGLLRETPASLISMSSLSQVAAHLQVVAHDLTSFVAEQNSSYISSAALIIDQSIAPLLWGAFLKAPYFAPDSLPKLMAAQAAHSQDAIRQLSGQREDLHAQLTELQSKITAQEASLSSLVTGAAQERAEAAAAVANLNLKFAEHETVRLGEFQTALTELRSNFGIFDEKMRGDGEKLIAAMEGYRNEAAKIVQIVGNIGVTGNYQNIAQSEAREAAFWRGLTVVFFLFGVLLAGTTFVSVLGEHLDGTSAWSVVIRLLYAIVIALPAFYTARESARHRTNSDRARQTELELASIGPFIESLKDDKKMEIREQLTKHYFGRPVESHTVDNPINKAFLDTIVKVIRESKK